jgi:hypothetical protein
MKQDRPIKELLELMLEHQKLFETGLCLWSDSLFFSDKISFSEMHKLIKYIKDNKPWTSFFRFSAYYWPIGQIEPRIEWINEHIKKLSK